MRRILLLITDLEVGGTPTVVRELATRLHNPPHVEMRVACLKAAGPVAEQIETAGIDVSALGVTRPTQLLRAARRLRELVNGHQIDTVFSFLVHANVVAALAAKRLPSVRFLQSIQTVQPRPRWHWWAQRWAHRRAEKIIAPSTAVVQAAQSRSGVSESKCLVVPNAVDISGFGRVEVFRGPAVRLGFLGRLDPVKRLDVALRAAWEVRDLPAEMWVFYSGDSRNYRYWQERELLDPHGEIFKWRNGACGPQAALAHMDVLLVPSLGEGFGLVVIEAMASGVPVIASAAGGILDIVKHEWNGLLVPPGRDDHLQFAQAIRRLHGDSALRARIIENAWADVSDRFTWDKILPQYHRVLGIQS